MSEDDGYIGVRKTGVRYSVCPRTVTRWLENPELNFPRPTFINKRRFWRIADLVAWERARASGKTPEAA
jgi:hypothetical protein